MDTWRQTNLCKTRSDSLNYNNLFIQGYAKALPHLSRYVKLMTLSILGISGTEASSLYTQILDRLDEEDLIAF